MSYMNSSINDSSTIIDKAAAALATPAMLAMVYNGDGNLAIASTAGAPVIGISIAEIDDAVPAGGDITVAIKDIVLWKAGAAIAKGAEVMTDATGKAVTAVSEGFIVGYALDAAGAANDIIHVQIAKAGYKA